MKKAIPLFVITFLAINGYCQNLHKIDSLKNELIKSEHFKEQLSSKATALTDSAEAIILNKIGYEYRVTNYDTAMYYAQQSLSLSENIGFKKGIGGVYRTMGAIYYYKQNYPLALDYEQRSSKIKAELEDKDGVAREVFYFGNIYTIEKNFPEALKNYREAIKLLEQVGDRDFIINSYNKIAGNYNSQSKFNDEIKTYEEELNYLKKTGDKKDMESIYGTIGLSYLNLGDYSEALENYQGALKIHEETGNKGAAPWYYNNIGNIYNYMENYSEALKNYRKALSIDEKIGDTFEIAATSVNVGEICCKQGDYTEALKNEFTALKLGEKIKRNDVMGWAYYELGLVNQSQRNYSEALKNYFNSVNTFLKTEDKQVFGDVHNGITDSYNGIGIVYEKQGDLQQALNYENKGLSLAREIGAKDKVKDAYEELAKINAKLQNFKAAYDDEVLYKQTFDTVFSKANQQKITDLQMQYDFDKQEDSAKAVQGKKDAITAIEIKNQKRTRNYILTGLGVVAFFLVVVVFFLVFVFRQRNRISKEKKRSEELLLNILPAETAEELKDTGTAKAKHFDEVTVMFTDFKGFTQISEKLSPEQLVAEIDYCFRGFDKIVEKYGIEKIKTIGDSYMCAGGLPVKNVTNPDDVVKAALEIKDFMLTLKREKEAKNEIPFEIRIGVHTGSVVAGIVGVKKFAYDIWGDTVNLASRMESSGVEGQVNISETTYRLIKDKFACTYRGKIQTKNKGKLDMYFVTGQSIV